MKNFYRPDIDALRGIAILSVLLYHAKISFNNIMLFKGGFLGVDIFFVITGFLITTLLVKEYEKSNTINILSFYLRRIRRLVPVLLLVIIISTFFSFFLLDPVKIKEFSTSVYFSLIFLPNFYFHYFGNFYGQSVNLFKPLLHLWSLGVEEQFYIFFPLFLIIIFKFFKRFLVIALFFGFFASLLFANYASENHIMFSFYMLPSRAWEIILGSLIAIYFINNKKNYKISIYAKNILYILSLFIIIFFFQFFDIYNNKHPSLITLIPLLACVTIIFLGNTQKNFFLYNLLTNKIFIFFGKISYSLYLFHFIIFSFYRNSYLPETLIAKILLISFSVIISYFSYKYIEQTFRNKAYPASKLFKFIFSLTFAIISINLYFHLNKQLLDKDYNFDGVHITEWNDTEKIRKENINNMHILFPDNNKTNVLIIGNCHSIETYMSFKLNSKEFNNFNFAQYGIDLYNFFENTSNSALYKNADIIIISTRWEEGNTKKNFDKMNSLIDKIKKDKKKIIIFSNFPEFEYKESNYKLRRIELTNYKKEIINYKSINLSDDLIYKLKQKYYSDHINNHRLIKINKKLEDIAKIKNVTFFDVSKLTCDHKLQVCNFRLDDSKDEIFRDYGRYSYRGLKYMGSLLYEYKILEN